MKSVTSISGGKTSAYLATHYPTDYNVFSLVRIEDKKCLFPDAVMRKRVEDRIRKPFIGTAEDDMIIYTIFDLEQHLGREISWVSGVTFDEVIKTKGGWLPSVLHRFCTYWLKLSPIFYWWASEIGEVVQMNIGYRANEMRRVLKMNERLNQYGLLEEKATFEKHPDGRNKWEQVAWQKPEFPLYDDRIGRDIIELYWGFHSVRFAPLNNCVGCFHRNPLLLKKMFEAHPKKMNWFEQQEGHRKGFDRYLTWRSDVTYTQIRKSELQMELQYEDFSECDSGYCGI